MASVFAPRSIVLGAKTVVRDVTIPSHGTKTEAKKGQSKNCSSSSKKQT